MKSLYESLLDDEEEIVDKVDIKPLIKEWLKEYDIRNYKINKDNTIDVKGSVSLYHYPESELPSYIQFKKVTGSFYLNNSKLETLKGVPEKVDWSFDCSGCTNLKTLEGAPGKVGMSFNCNGCTSLKTLEGAPKEVGRDFDCSYCDLLKTLKGAPKYVGERFYCTDCNSLKTLEGAPEKVSMNFYCNDCNSLKTLEGAPKEVGGNFVCRGCKKLYTTKTDITKICKVNGSIYI